jgi:hypothetical protein
MDAEVERGAVWDQIPIFFCTKQIGVLVNHGDTGWVFDMDGASCSLGMKELEQITNKIRTLNNFGE